MFHLGTVFYQDPLLHFDAPRLIALREGGMIKDTLAKEYERKVHVRAPAHVHQASDTQPTHPFAAGEGLQPAAHSQRALRAGLMAPTWRPALCILGVIPDLTWLSGLSFRFHTGPSPCSIEAASVNCEP
jgi:hypothetical protein